MTKIALDAAFTPTSRTLTPEGYLCVKGIAARTGVYQYLSTELGLPGPVREVNVYRPPSEVFSPESLASYPDSDVTNDHPEDLVSAITYRDHSVGHVRGAMQDGEDVVVDMIIKDQSAIDDIQSGKSELSPGYLAEYVPVNGYAPDGTNYGDVNVTKAKLLYTFPLSGTTCRASRDVRINPYNLKLFAQHDVTGVSLAASGNTVKLFPLGLQSN